MVRLNSLLTSVSLGLLSLSGGSSAAQNIYKRYDNSTSCSTATSVSAVSVYGPAYSGAVSHQYSAPTIVGEWVDAPVWSIYIPQDVYNFTGLELVLNHLSSAIASADAFTLYSGDIGNFVNPGAIYSKSIGGITFDGKTQAPLLKIVFAPGFDSSASSYSVDFTLALDIIPSGSFAKRDVQTFDLSSTINKPGGSSSSAVPVSSTPASTSSESSSSSVETSISSSSSSSSGTLTSSLTTSLSSSSATHGTATTTSTVGSTVCTEEHCTKTGSTVTTKTTSSETITSCSDGKCTEVPTNGTGSVVTTKTTLSKTITSCSDGKCTETPVTSAPGTKVIVGSTTTLTITSCADHGCTLHTVPAVGSVVTTTVDETVSTYTTYCPLAPTNTATTVPGTTISSASTTSVVPGTPVSSASTSTVTSRSSTIVFTSSTSATAATQSSSSISIYVAGANDLRANALTGGIAGLIAGFALMV